MAAPTIDTWDPKDGIHAPAGSQEAAPTNGNGDAPKEGEKNLSENVSNLNIGEGEVKKEGDEEVSQAELSLMKKLVRSKLVKSSNDLEIIRADPNSPLHSVKTFEELRLPEELLKGPYDMGFQAPSKIQETALPILLATPPGNLIAQSQSGTGKTAAFLLASLARVDTSQNHPQVLILSPTYELAIQTGEVARTMAKYKKDLRFCYAVRGAQLNRGEQVTDHVILGTPGKVFDWAIRFRHFDIRKIKVFVLDEADVMIDTQGHRNQTVNIRRKLVEDGCQLMLFSATYAPQVMDFAEMIVTNPTIIRLKREEQSLDNIKQYYVVCSNEQQKYISLANIFGSIDIGQTFIFCHTKKSAAWLYEKLRKDGHSVGLITGDLTVEQRTDAIKSFRDGKERVLISTNLMARGIDVDQVTVVINYDLPVDNETKKVDYETYLHRIGRTGRFGKFGLAFNFVDSAQAFQMVQELEHYFGKKITKLNANDLEELEKINQE